MILDERLEIADATALPTGTGTTLIGDVIDLGATPQDLGLGKALYFVVQVTTAVTSLGSSTTAFTIASDATATIATSGAATEHIVSEAIPKATLVAGYTRIWALPPEGDNVYERYLGLLVTNGTAALTAGAINAFLTFDPSWWKSYADGTN